MKRVSNWVLGCTGALAFGLAAGGAFAAAKSSAAPVEHPNFDGVWQVQRAYNVQQRTLPDDGTPVPFVRWGQAIYDAAAKAEAAGDPWTPNNQRCLVAGLVRALKGNFPWQMVQTKDQLAFIFEEDGRINQIPFRADHKKHLKPTWYGDPIARWEGDTAVIDTVGFNEKTPFILAIYHTPELHTVARMRLINGGKQLEILTKIDDPGAYTHPWQTKLVFDRMPPAYKLRDYRCVENNRDLPTTGMWGPD